MTRITLAQSLSLITISIIASLLIGQCYALAFKIISPTWLAAVLLHTFVAIPISVYWWKRGRQIFTLGQPQAYLPALLIVFGSSILALITSGGLNPSQTTWSHSYTWATVFWVPVVEEIVFRCGFSALIRRLTSPFWAAWFGSLVFAMAHAQPSWDRLISGQVGLALGAFLLGLACEYLLLWTKSIVPSIALHAACNATVMIFGVVDARWLKWLEPLYL